MKKYYYTIGEVSNLLDLKPYVIRYWETEFPQLKPRKGQHRNRQFTDENIDLLRRIKDMLYNQKFTIDGARQKLKQSRKAPEQMELELFAEPLPQAGIATSDKAAILAVIHELKKQIKAFKDWLEHIDRSAE